MNKFQIILICTAVMVITAGSVFSQSPGLPIQGIQDAMKNFSEDVSFKIPMNSTIGLNWSDAHIGKFPKFGVGFSAGFTTLGMGSIDGLLTAAGATSGNIPSFLKNMGMPLPGYTVEGRIGGFGLPFDIGIKFGMLPLDRNNFSVDYMLAGIDVRYALIDNPVSPVKISVGLGYNYLKGGVGVRISDIIFNVPAGGGSYTIKLQDPKIGFNWGTNCIELKGQLSLKFPVITPYAGAGFSVAFSKAGYRFTALLTDGSGNDIGSDIINAMNAFGITGISGNGFESIINTRNFNIRLYGGFSLNLFKIKIDLTALYNLGSGNLGATLAGRFQL